MRWYRVILFTLLVIASLIPVFLRQSRYIKNPKELQVLIDNKRIRYLCRGKIDENFPKEARDEIKTGDVETDGNGDLTKQIMDYEYPYVTLKLVTKACQEEVFNHTILRPDVEFYRVGGKESFSNKHYLFGFWIIAIEREK